MFSTGDKVIACMAASSKKGTLKVGSVGRVRRTNYTTISIDPDNRDDHAMLFDLEVVLTRSGYETKKRFETKTIHTFMPLIYPSRIDSGVTAEEAAKFHVDSVEEKFEKLDKHRDFAGLSSSYILNLLLPYDNLPIDIIHDEDSMAWFETVCRSRRFQEIIIHLIDERGRHNGAKRKSSKYDWLDNDTLQTMHQAISNRDTRLTVLTKEKYEYVKKAMKRIHDTSFDPSGLIRSVETYLRDYNNLRRSGNRDSIYTADDFFSNLYQYMYSSIELAIIRTTIDSYQGDPGKIGFAADMFIHIGTMMMEKFSDILNKE